MYLFYYSPLVRSVLSVRLHSFLQRVFYHFFICVVGHYHRDYAYHTVFIKTDGAFCTLYDRSSPTGLLTYKHISLIDMTS